MDPAATCETDPRTTSRLRGCACLGRALSPSAEALGWGGRWDGEVRRVSSKIRDVADASGPGRGTERGFREDAEGDSPGEATRRGVRARASADETGHRAVSRREHWRVDGAMGEPIFFHHKPKNTSIRCDTSPYPHTPERASIRRDVRRLVHRLDSGDPSRSSNSRRRHPRPPRSIQSTRARHVHHTGVVIILRR